MLEGAAVFKQKKMLGWLSPEEARGLAWISNEVEDAVVTIPCIDNEKKKISVEIKKSKTKLTSYIEGEMPSILIELEGKGNISEEGCTSTLPIEKYKMEVKKKIEEKITRNINETLNKIQKEYKSDVVGFGKVIHAEHKKAWNRNIKDNWDKIFPEVEVRVEVNIDITNSALYQEPLKINK